MHVGCDPSLLFRCGNASMFFFLTALINLSFFSKINLAGKIKFTRAVARAIRGAMSLNRFAPKFAKLTASVSQVLSAAPQAPVFRKRSASKEVLRMQIAEKTTSTRAVPTAIRNAIIPIQLARTIADQAVVVSQVSSAM